MNKELITKCPECKSKLEYKELKLQGKKVGEILECKKCGLEIEFEITDKEIVYRYDWKFLSIRRKKTNEK